MDRLLPDPPVVRTLAQGCPFTDPDSGSAPVIERNEIHLWTVPCRDLDNGYETLSKIISHEERRTARQFRKPADARDYSLRHGYLRLVLGHYLRTEPSLIPLIATGHGKPRIDSRSGLFPLSFSISRSREMIALAIARHSDIGIDVVKTDTTYPFSEAADYLFSPAERAFIESAPADRQLHRFYRIWAIKEALLKARGGTAMMMCDTDVAGIAGNVSGDLRAPVHGQYSGRDFYFWECPVGNGHYCVIAAGIPEEPTGICLSPPVNTPCTSPETGGRACMGIGRD